MIFVCPICKKPLKISDGTARCGKGHAFDRAAEGYYHLLPPNKMHAKIPGDSKEMVASRRSFLEAGYYQPFSDGINQTAAELLSGCAAPVILDAGCGEGYYTGRLAAALPHAQIYGFDISKFAVKAAAKRYRDIHFAVASIFDIPVSDYSCDLLLNVFAPIVPEQFFHAVKPGGYLIIAVPGREHLYGLKEILYDKPYYNEITDTAYDGFSFVKRVELPHAITLTAPQQMQNLFRMTPYFWKTPREGGERLQKTAVLKTELQFDLLIYQKM